MKNRAGRSKETDTAPACKMHRGYPSRRKPDHHRVTLKTSHGNHTRTFGFRLALKGMGPWRKISALRGARYLFPLP